jgi:GWxTD domain-containing protein
VPKPATDRVSVFIEPIPGREPDGFAVAFRGADGSEATGAEFSLPAGKVGTWELTVTVASEVATGGGFLFQRRGFLLGHRTVVGVILLAVVWSLRSVTGVAAQELSAAAVDSIYKSGLKARDARGVLAAASRLEAAVPGFPEPAKLLSRIGMLYLRTGATDKARSAFHRAIQHSAGQVDAHVGLGRIALELEDDPEQALAHFRAAMAADSTYKWAPYFAARAASRIGLALIKEGVADSARSMLQEAISHDPDLASSHIGLGRVALELKRDPDMALSHFQAAAKLDSTNAEVHYLLVRTYEKLKDHVGARKSADRTIRLDPAHAQAYLLLARSHRAEGNRKAALVYIKKYLEQKPSDQEPAYAFALELMEEGRFREVEEITSRMTNDEALPLLAQSLMKRGDFESAAAAFELFMKGLSTEERNQYTDISLVALPHELEAYQETPEEKRADFLRQFWLRHDPLKASGGWMRRAEHYRRVWYARTFFGEGKWPWDRRGEVYIRYGEPDYRSTSEKINAQVPPAVQQVQDKMAYELYGQSAIGLSFQGPVFPIRTGLGFHDDPPQEFIEEAEGFFAAEEGLSLEALEEPFPEARVHLDPEFTIGLTNWKPVVGGNNWAAIPWEVWIYANVGTGLEVAFTDERRSNAFDYAPVPGVTKRDLDQLDEDRYAGQTAYMRLVQRLTEYAPGVRVQTVASSQPEHYDVAEFEPLDFYYDVVSFRGRAGKTDLQLNIGIPIESVILEPDTAKVVKLNRRVALLDAAESWAVPMQRDLQVPISGQRAGRALLDRVDVIDFQPGDYKVAVQVHRYDTNRLQAYVQELSLEDYSGADLMLSDLFVAKEVSEAASTSDPNFVRGKWRIIPLPSHVFHVGQHVFIYFEIYNLTRDEFGGTRYRVTYEVRGTDETGISSAPLLTRILGRQAGATVTVSYEQTGTEESVLDYVGLDIGDASPGRYTVQMTVKDLHSGQEATKERTFWVKSRSQ